MGYGYVISHHKWEEGSGYSYSTIVETTTHFTPGDAEAFAKDYAANDPEHDYSGDKFTIQDLSTNMIVDEFTFD